MGRNRGIPVVMYHSIVPGRNLWARISDPLEEFEKVLEGLCDMGFRTVFLDDFYKWMKGNAVLPEKTIVLTFDDGYLDNWLYVFPLLKKFGLKATIFPSLEFIGEGPARSLDDFPNTEESIGYLNWSELCEMQNSGFVDIQSHTMTHSWEFCTHDLVDILEPSPKYNWIAWNDDRSVKPFWKPHKIEPGLREGYPVFRYDRSLGVRRFIPDEGFVERVLADVKERGGISRIAAGGEKLRLMESYNEFAPEQRGRPETDEEFKLRIDYELGASREILSHRLKKPVRFLCWPGGARHEFLNDHWSSYGYLATSLPQSASGRISNLPSDSPEAFVRIPSGLGEWRLIGRPVSRLSSGYFRELLDNFSGVPGALTRMRLKKLGLLAGRLLPWSERGW